MGRSRWITLSLLMACSRSDNEASKSDRHPAPSRPAREAPQAPAEVSPPEPSEPVFKGPPPDYGHLKLPDGVPEPESLTVHAVAGYVVVAVYERPNMDARQLGYIRLGTRMMVTPAIEGSGCAKGWHGLPQGGYACASKGLVVDAKRPPYLPSPPSPRVDDAIPYDYAFVRRWNTPMWWRIPTTDEQRIANDLRVVREQEREGIADEAAEGGDPGAEPDATATATLPSVTDEPAPVAEDTAVTGAVDEAGGADSEATPEEEAEPVKLPLSPETPWLERGYFLSVGEEIEADGDRAAWWKTARGAYVEKSATTVYQTKDYQGMVLDDIEYPFGFVMADEESLYELQDGDRLKKVKAVERRTFLDLEGETEIRGKRYLLTSDGLLVREKVVRLPDLQSRPADLEPWERWVDVSLEKQILIAYEGDLPVFITLVSTGKKGTEEEPFETPTGRWRIRSKHISSTMDGNTASDGNYSIQDVPWAMFFDGSYALHGAFWHRGFGYRRSHGCVNLGPSDARWLFFWTTPYLPSGWHGVHANEQALGTTVIVRP